MTKTISIVLAILFCISIVSCGKKKVEYTFYLGNGTADEDSTLVEGFQDISGFDFLHVSSSTITVDESSVTSVQSFSIDGETWESDYRRSKELSLNNCAKKKLQTYGIIDSYRYETPQTFVSLDFYHKTGKLKDFLLVLDSDKELPETTLTDDQLIEKAKNAVLSYYGKDALDQYKAGEVSYSENENWYSIDFSRYLHGYKADATFRVILNSEGKVRRLLCTGHYEFGEVENDVTKEMIQNAETALRANIPEGLTVQENITKMVMDAHTGKLYLRMYAYEQPTYDENGEKMPTRSNLFYVNIE